MKAKVLITAMALMLVSTTQALAQQGVVGWTALAGTCSVDSKSAAHKFTFGTVMFSGTASGNITLYCPIDAITRMNPTDVNAWGLIFRNDNGFVGGVDKCTVSAALIQYPHSTPTHPILLDNFSTSGNSYSGFTTVDPLTTGSLPLNIDANTYIVSINLNRVSGATCNPQVWMAFAEEIIF